ncbi:MAG: NAD(P)/FAD-dependent oxidoreductase [Clostridia bacterium]|nr:NAD(P)/FAD-dependent oxidoreductase [Clostridia bacterium]
MRRYVIIGNGHAAVGCIEGIRSADTDGEISVISEEAHHVYSRPLISYYLEGKTDLSRMKYRPDDFYEKNRCKTYFARRAVSVNKVEKTVTLDSGESLPYDALCVAAGSSPFIPPFSGLDSVVQRFSFMTLDDALAIEKAVTKDTKVLIVGAGLIGLKCAEGLLERAKSITVCDLADRVLSSILDTECAALMQKHLEEHGIEFMLADTAVSFEGGTATMKSGKTIDFDVLILAVGVRANTKLLADIGAEVNRGIIIDERMKTSVESIYAAGDCTEGFDASLGAKRVLAILPNAYMQGHTAGVNMAGGDEIFDNAIPMNSIGFFGLHAMTAGTYDGELYEEKGEDSIKRLYIKDGYLKGYMLIGRDERAGIYTSLIREGVPLDTLDVEEMKKIASNTIFSRDTRRKRFGGVV